MLTKRSGLALACTRRYQYHTAILYWMTDSVAALEDRDFIGNEESETTQSLRMGCLTLAYTAST